MSNKQVFYYPIANEDIYNIWKTTLEKWSEKQADNYILGLYKTADLALNKEKPWRQLPPGFITDITTNKIYFVTYKRHYIFFKEFEENEGIGVIAILYDGMDIPIRIKERF